MQIIPGGWTSLVRIIAWISNRNGTEASTRSSTRSHAFNRLVIQFWTSHYQTAKVLSYNPDSSATSTKKIYFMNFKKALNLNSYEWWRNHRRFVTLGIFLALFAGYVRGPFANDFNVRDTCGRLNSNYQITGDEAIKKLNLKPVQDYDNRSIANYYCERFLGINK